MTLSQDDFEAGTNVTARVRGEKSGGMVVSVRLAAEDSDRLVELAEETGRTASDLARQAIRSFLKLNGQPISFAVEVTYGTPPSTIDASLVAETRSDRETFAPTVLQTQPA